MNTIDELFDKDPEELSPGDIDAIIAYEREARLKAESGIKVKKVKGGDGPQVTAADLMALFAKSAEVEAPKPALPKSVRRF